MSGNLDIDGMKELIKMKNENPEEYKKFLFDLSEVLTDFNKILSLRL